MAIYTHSSGHITQPAETPPTGLTPILFISSGAGIAFHSELSSATQLVYTITPTFGLSYTLNIFGAFVFDDFGNYTGAATQITSLNRMVDGTLIDTISAIQSVPSAAFAFPIGASTVDVLLQGNDLLQGFAGRDAISGLEGNDTIHGYGGQDNLVGGAGADRIYGGGGNDALSGGSAHELGKDLLDGGTGDDTLAASESGCTLLGGGGNDALFGNAGADVLDGGTGADTFFGGLGNDTIHVGSSADRVYEDPNGGRDTILTTISFNVLTHLIGSPPEIEVLDARDATQGVSLVGSGSTDMLLGSAQDDHLTSGRGPGGTTTLDGRGGNDTMTGGLGDDRYYVDSAGDMVIDPGDANIVPDGGLDTVYASTDYSLAALQRIERLFANAGATGLALTGNEFANTLRGGGGDDRLDGGQGIDRLTGGQGADTFVLQTRTVDRDVIADFTHDSDLIRLDQSRFGALDGAIAFADRFLANATGAVADGGTLDTRIIYNTTTGQFYFDANGTAAGRTTLIATLTGAPDLDAFDFLIV